MRKEQWDQNAGDPFSLQSFNHLSMILVITCLVGTNFRSWSRAIRIVFDAKQKLGFVDGTISVSKEDSNIPATEKY